VSGVDLVTFLRARLDEREAAAKAAGGDTWVAEPRTPGSYAVACDGEPVVYDEGAPTEEQAAHIALNDPVFVLADVAAKRRILSRHRRYGEVEPSGSALWNDACDGCGFPGDPGVAGNGTRQRLPRTARPRRTLRPARRLRPGVGRRGVDTAKRPALVGRAAAVPEDLPQVSLLRGRRLRGYLVVAVVDRVGLVRVGLGHGYHSVQQFL
jgi:hypothetical protein